MLIAGLIVLALAAVAAGAAYRQHRKHDEPAAVEGSTCGHMRQLADAVSMSAGGGGFRQRCELTGVAKATSVGTVNAPQTGRAAVWYRTKVTHESRVLQDEKSNIPFAVDDGTGQAVIHAEDAEIDAPVQVLDQVDEDGSKREEWILPVDTRLFVQGEVTDEEGHLRLRKPKQGSFRVSTRSEQGLMQSSASARKWSAAAAGALAAVGLVLIVVELVA